MDRRMFLSGSLGLAGALALPRITRAAQATPDAASDLAYLPTLELKLTDTGFEIAEPLTAGRYHMIVSNTGNSTDSHTPLGKFPTASPTRNTRSG